MRATRIVNASLALAAVGCGLAPEAEVGDTAQALVSCTAPQLNTARENGTCGPGLDGTVIERCTETSPSQYYWVPIECDVTDFPASTGLCDTSAVHNWASGNAVMVDIENSSHTGWADVLDDLVAGKTHIALAAGDYTTWAALIVDGDTAPDNIVIEYYDTDYALHPVDRRAPSTEALIEGIMFRDGIAGWIVHGLTIREPTTAPNTNGLFHVLNGSGIIIDSVLVEDSAGSFGIRVRDGHNNCVQNSVVRNSTSMLDHVGIGVKPNTGNITGVKIVNNEVYNWMDAIQITDYLSYTVGFWIENNDLYVTDERYVIEPVTGKVLACAENGIDIKVGAASTSRIIRNRLWGFRETPNWMADEDLQALCGASFTSGASGSAIVAHVNAQHVDIEDNIIGDSVHGIERQPAAGSGYFEYNWNYLYDTPADDAAINYNGGTRAVLLLYDDTSVISNWFAYTDTLCRPTVTWNPSAATFLGNAHVGPSAIIQGSCNYSGNFERSAPYDFRYARKRWTGPENVLVDDGY